MAILACAVSLGRDTTGHDWYAAYTLTVADLMIGAGFDGDEPVEYRSADGVVETVSRSLLTHTFEARWARKGILEAAWNGATLGALSGFGGALLCFVLVWRSMEGRRGRLTSDEPAPDQQHEARERFVPPQHMPMAAPATAEPGLAAHSSPRPATSAETPASADRLPDSQPHGPAKPEIARTQQDRPDPGNDNKAESARRERRNRDYGRWV